jgi:hypothetical protein
MSNEEMPENNDSQEQESENKIISDIAKGLCLGLITDRELSNNLSGLDQVIYFNFKLDPKNPTDVHRQKEIKLQIYNRIDCDFNGGCYLPTQEIDEEELLYYLEEDIDDDLLLHNFIYHSYGKEKYLSLIEEIATSVIQGVITFDGYSEFDDPSGVEQAIISRTAINPTYYDEDWDLLRLIKLNVLARVKEFEGGNRIEGEGTDIFEFIPLWTKL